MMRLMRCGGGVGMLWVLPDAADDAAGAAAAAAAACQWRREALRIGGGGEGVGVEVGGVWCWWHRVGRGALWFKC